MVAVKTVRDRLTDLEAEHSQLIADLRALEASAHDARTELDARYIAIERSGASASDAAKAERALEENERAIYRKRRAIEAVEADLLAERDRLAQANHEAALKRLKTLRTKAANLAAKLDGDLTDVDAWLELWDVHNEFFAIRRQLQQQGGFPPGATYAAPWKDPGNALADRLEALRLTVDARRTNNGRHISGPHTVAAALGLD